MGLSNTAVMFAILLIAGVAHVQAEEPREMKSDAEYQKDLVKDNNPTEPHVFDYPYPAPQEDSSFDNDFVKDDNADMGEWAAQMEYDRLRSMIKRSEKNLPKLKENRERAEAKYQDAVGEAAKVDKEVKEGEPPAEIQAEVEEVEAEEEEKDADVVIKEETVDVDVPEEVEMQEVPLPVLPKMPEKPEVVISSKGVDEAVSHLKECEAKVVEAKDNLLKLLKDREALVKAKQEADATAATAEEESAAAKKAFEELEPKIKEANEVYEKADAQYKKEVNDVEKLKSSLENSETIIKQMRGQAADSEGGIKSGAPKSVSSMLCVLAVAFVTLLSF